MSIYPYKTLQDCASNSVSKLYNFPLTYLVTFVNKLVFCFFPKHLGLPVLIKYFVKILCLCLEVGLDFCYFTLTLGHFYTYNIWKIHVDAFPQSCRCGNYLSFVTLVTPITVLRAEQFAFPCKFFFCWTLAEEVLSMSRNENWSLLRQSNSKSIWWVSNKLDLL